MKPIVPTRAVVRPRVSRRGQFERRLLEEVVLELVEENPAVPIRIAGAAGNGKSMAIAHLAAVFADDPRLEFFDDPAGLAPSETGRVNVSTIATADTPLPDDLRLAVCIEEVHRTR